MTTPLTILFDSLSVAFIDREMPRRQWNLAHMAE
jgi:hypothetical protein